MSQQQLIEIVTNTLRVTLLMVTPFLVTALLISLLISIIQVVTSIQDMTLTFIPKIFVVFAVMLFLFPWLVSTLLAFTTDLIRMFPALVN